MSKKLFSQITGQVHDASGIDNPHDYYWEETNGIWYPIEVEQEVVKPMRPPLSIGEVRDLLDKIMEKINSNMTGLWWDDISTKSECVILQDTINEDNEGETKYNGWYDDLINLKNQL
jgi:hypothetical protein